MKILAGFGSFIWVVGMLVLLINAFSDSATATPSHVDVIGLALAVSGSILALGAKE